MGLELMENPIMIAPKEYANERERLNDLASYSILDTLSESDYDNLTAIAAEICGTPISLVSLLDNKRQWFKSHHGLDVTETPKEYSFCGHAINDKDNVFIVQDAREDIRFQGNPLVTGEPYVIFYAGVPLVSDEGFPLGTLCVIDHEPKKLSEGQVRSLVALSKQVMNLLKLRKSEKLLAETLKTVEEKNFELERFAFIAAHDLSSPLVSMSGMAKLFLQEYGVKVDDEGRKMLELVVSSAENLQGLIKGLLDYSRCDNILKEEKSLKKLSTLRDKINDFFSFDYCFELTLKSELEEIWVNSAAIDQILINLVCNAIKYSHRDRAKIEIGVSSDDTHYKFYVKDNGPGIPLKEQGKIFEMFNISAEKDRYGQTGYGIGLATVKKLVEKSGGDIVVESSAGKGTKFVFTLERPIFTRTCDSKASLIH